VFACLGRNDEFALIDFQLYLPESSANDPDRCAKAKIPEDQHVYQPKWRQALDLVKRARANKVKLGWVGADALYGNNHEFLDALEDSGERSMADIHSNHKVWLEFRILEKPTPRTGKRGRPATKLKLAASPDRSLYQRVDRICSDHFEQNSEEVSFRAGAKGQLSGRFYKRVVWTWDEKNGSQPRRRILIIREDESGDLKYSLTNFPPETSLNRLAYIQNQRYWIEHSFHEAKNELGMSQYQVRVWQGWHHHMALVCLATVFMAKEKQTSKPGYPLLSCRDIVELLDHYLPRRYREEEELHAQIQKRHAARKRDIDRRKQHKPGLRKDRHATK
jgi:SRSO17 transposase